MRALHPSYFSHMSPSIQSILLYNQGQEDWIFRALQCGEEAGS